MTGEARDIVDAQGRVIKYVERKVFVDRRDPEQDKEVFALRAANARLEAKLSDLERQLAEAFAAR